MHSSFRAEKTTIYELLAEFTNIQLRVPDYQRGYSWEKEQFAAFLQDLTTFTTKRGSTEEQIYFLGPIVLMNAPASEELSWIVDGQQRVVTSAILLATMRDIADSLTDEDGTAARFADDIHSRYLTSEGMRGGEKWSLRLGDLDHVFFERHVLRRDRAENLIPRCPSNGLIKQARRWFEQSLRGVLESQSDRIGYLARLMRTVTHRATMLAIYVDNERDAMTVFERTNVRGRPLSDADLVRNRLMVEAGSKTGRKEIRKRWGRVQDLLGQDARVAVFLQHMWESRFGGLAGTKLYEALDDYLTDSSCPAQDFADWLVDDAAAYAEFMKQESTALHHAGRRASRSLHATLGVKAALPFLLSAYRRFGKAREFSNVAAAAEALAVRHRVLAQRKSGELRRCFLEAAAAINDAPSKEWAQTRCLSILRQVNPSDQEVVSAVGGKMKLGKRTALYLLRELEDFHGDLKSHRAAATLEHIFPVQPRPEEWSRAEKLMPYLWHLGNLALLTSEDNTRASNRGYAIKKQRVYANATLKTTTEILNYPRWGLSPLLRRATDLAKIAIKRWVV